MDKVASFAFKHWKEHLDISRIEAEKDLSELYEQYALVARSIGRVSKIEEIIQKLDNQNKEFCVEPK